MGRSFKLHRPRGVLGAGVEEPNALVDIDRGGGRTDPNQRATTVPLYEGLKADSQNRWPTLERDRGRSMALRHRCCRQGSYYKTFKWPRGAWRSCTSR
jgi:sarcosine oxidase subunit alpha